MKYFILLLLIILSLVLGCREANFSNPLDANNVLENHPAIVSVDGSYTYTINARNYSAERNDSLLVHIDTLVITLTVDQYQSGTCDVFIKDNSGNTLFSEYSTGSKSVVLIKKFNSIPSSILISQNNLTAKVSIVLAEKK